MGAPDEARCAPDAMIPAESEHSLRAAGGRRGSGQARAVEYWRGHLMFYRYLSDHVSAINCSTAGSLARSMFFPSGLVRSGLRRSSIESTVSSMSVPWSLRV